MKTEGFPVNYFRSIWTPLQTFINRFKLSWPAMIVVLIFLNALMTVPVTINFAQMENFPLEELYPNVANILEHEELSEFSEATYQNGQMIISEPKVLENDNGVVTFGLDAEEDEKIVDVNNLVSFEKSQFILKEEGAPTAIVPYTEDFSLEQANNHKEVMAVLSEQWFAQNQVFIVAFFTLLLSFLQFVMLVLTIFGSALFFYATKNSPVTSIKTYKESVNLLINAISLPTILAMLFGLISFNVITMQMIQIVGLIAMLMVIYFKIQFNDENIEPKVGV